MDTTWSPSAVRMFELLFRPWMHRKLAGICQLGVPRSLPGDHSVILAANHTSWWDAFLLRGVHRSRADGHPLITLMQEDQLDRFPFFRWMGVCGVDRSISSLRHAVRTIRRFRRRGPCWISIFPQGTIRPSWKRPMEFRPGIGFFLRELKPAVVLPVGIHFEMLKYPCPTAFVAVGDPVYEPGGRAVHHLVERRVIAQVDAIYTHLTEYGEDAGESWTLESARTRNEPGERRPHDLLSEDQP